MKTLALLILAGIFASLAVHTIATIDPPLPERQERPNVAAELVRAHEGMRDYLVNTPRDLARIKRENDAHLARMCKAGRYPAEYCPNR